MVDMQLRPALLRIAAQLAAVAIAFHNRKAAGF
jgi:hypothetical protein